MRMECTNTRAQISSATHSGAGYKKWWKKEQYRREKEKRPLHIYMLYVQCIWKYVIHGLMYNFTESIRFYFIALCLHIRYIIHFFFAMSSSSFFSLSSCPIHFSLSIRFIRSICMQCISFCVIKSFVHEFIFHEWMDFESIRTGTVYFAVSAFACLNMYSMLQYTLVCLYMVMS